MGNVQQPALQNAPFFQVDNGRRFAFSNSCIVPGAIFVLSRKSASAAPHMFWRDIFLFKGSDPHIYSANLEYTYTVSLHFHQT